MAISSSSTGLRPGVVTSTTRPTTPYTGMLIYETDTGYLRVWDGSAWDYLSQKQDTAQGLPAGDKMGLEYVASGTFSNAASFDVTGFSSTFDFYDLFIQAKSHSTAAEITMQLRSGSTARTVNYYGASYSISYLGVVGSYSTRNNGSNVSITQVVNSVSSISRLSIHGIDNTEFVMNLQSYDTNTSSALFGSYSNYAATNSFDTMRFSGTNNITGYWNLMGVRKA